jgi:hypothetical protein
MVSHKIGSRALLGTGIALVLACSAGGNEQNVLTVQPGGAPSGNGGGPPVIDTDPLAPNPNGDGFDLGDDLGDPVAPMGCQQAERKFDPKIPTVFLLVDRSATMFQQIGPNVTAWGALRTGVLEVMRELEASVNFGFGAFSGQNLGPDMCLLEVPGVLPALNNYDEIAQLYGPLETPTNTASIETPTALALAQAAEQLWADTTDSDKYILFVTDGEPDFCDNGNALCPPDSVVALLQDLAAGVDRQGAARPPIQTLVFGITAPTAPIRLPVLQNFANAGAGLPVAPLLADPNQAYDPTALYNQCRDVLGWKKDFATTGKPAEPGQSIATYAAAGVPAGTAPVYRPDPNDQAALTDQIRAALAGVKSCTFDLAEDGVQVDLTRQDLGQLARVIVNGAAVPFDAANGWSMLSETAVGLAGEACTSWRNPTIETSISFDFPCDIFVPR